MAAAAQARDAPVFSAKRRMDGCPTSLTFYFACRAGSSSARTALTDVHSPHASPGSHPRPLRRPRVLDGRPQGGGARPLAGPPRRCRPRLPRRRGPAGGRGECKQAAWAERRLSVPRTAPFRPGRKGKGQPGRGREGERKKKHGHAARPPSQPALSFHTLFFQVATSYASLLAGPDPLPATAPAHAFSEARAAAHVAALAGGDGRGGGDGAPGGGGRQVGTAGAAEAALYLHAQGAALASSAAAAGGHYAVETVTQYVTGAVDMSFLGVDLGNAWY